MSYFGEPSARIQKMKDELLDITPQVCVERAIYTTEAYKKHKDKLTILKRAYAIKNTLENMTIFIEDGGLLAGNQASANRAAPIFPEYAIGWVIDELDDREKSDGDHSTFQKRINKVLETLRRSGKGNTVKDKALALMPPLERKCYDLGIIKVEGNITAGDAHLAADYRQIAQSRTERNPCGNTGGKRKTEPVDFKT